MDREITYKSSEYFNREIRFLCCCLCLPGETEICRPRNKSRKSRSKRFMNIFFRRKEEIELTQKENIFSGTNTNKRCTRSYDIVETTFSRTKPSTRKQKHKIYSTPEGLPSPHATNEIVDSSNFQNSGRNCICHDDGINEVEASYIRWQRSVEQAMRKDFFSAVYEKLEKLKRDQDVRGNLEDCLKYFQPYSSGPVYQRKCSKQTELNKSHRSDADYRVHWNDHVLQENRPPKKDKYFEINKKENLSNGMRKEYLKNDGFRENKPPSRYQQKPLISKSKSLNKKHRSLKNNWELQNSNSNTMPLDRLKYKKTSHAKEAFTVVGFSYGAEAIPFITRIEGSRITLGQFKTLINKKQKYRYFFKTYRTDFGTDIVYEEIMDDNEILPLWDGKIFAIVEKV